MYAEVKVWILLLKSPEQSWKDVLISATEHDASKDSDDGVEFDAENCQESVADWSLDGTKLRLTRFVGMCSKVKVAIIRVNVRKLDCFESYAGKCFERDYNNLIVREHFWTEMMMLDHYKIVGF